MPNDVGEGIREWADGDEVRLNGLATATSVRDALRKAGVFRGSSYDRDSRFGVPTLPGDQLALQGVRFYNTDTGGWQQYYAPRSTSNPFGATSAGWIDDETAIVRTVSSDYASGWGTNTNDDVITYQRRNGWVFWTGILTRTNSTATGSVFTFPLGFRPPSRYSGFTQASGNVVAELSVRATGIVDILNNKATTGSMTVSASWPAVL